MIVGLVILFVLGIYTCITIIKGLKDKENLTVLPFGPALAIAGLLILLIPEIPLPLIF